MKEDEQRERGGAGLEDGCGLGELRSRVFTRWDEDKARVCWDEDKARVPFATPKRRSRRDPHARQLVVCYLKHGPCGKLDPTVMEFAASKRSEGRSYSIQRPQSKHGAISSCSTKIERTSSLPRGRWGQKAGKAGAFIRVMLDLNM